MKVTLEYDDIIVIIENHFKEKFDRSKIIIQANPFEITLCGVTIEGNTPPTAPNSSTRQHRLLDGETTEIPEEGIDSINTREGSKLYSEEEMLTQSRELEKTLDAKKTRNMGLYSTSTPPTSFKDEV